MHVSLDFQSSLVRNLLHFSFSLDEGLWNVRAINFNVDLGVVHLLLLLFFERPSIADKVERQQEAQHTDNKESNIDLEDRGQD